MQIEIELMRGAGPVAVLKTLERREMYGYELLEALGTHTDGLLRMGQSTLYPLLYNLEAKGLVSSRWDHADGRPRKYYRITAKGKTKLAAATKQWREIAKAMKALGVLAPRSCASGALA